MEDIKVQSSKFKVLVHAGFLGIFSNCWKEMTATDNALLKDVKTPWISALENGTSVFLAIVDF